MFELHIQHASIFKALTAGPGRGSAQLCNFIMHHSEGHITWVPCSAAAEWNGMERLAYHYGPTSELGGDGCEKAHALSASFIFLHSVIHIQVYMYSYTYKRCQIKKQLMVVCWHTHNLKQPILWEGGFVRLPPPPSLSIVIVWGRCRLIFVIG